MCALAIFAQSGRRVRKPEPTPVPTPEATPTPTPTEKPKPSITFIVGLDKHDESSRLTLYDYDGVLRSCVERLDNSSAVKADTSKHDMSRADAVRQAKAEAEAYIVWLQLRTTNVQTGVYDDPRNAYIEYFVFAPTTAKLVTSGTTYPQEYRNARIRVPTSSTAGNYYLNQAARGAAERILDHFHLRTAGTIP